MHPKLKELLDAGRLTKRTLSDGRDVLQVEKNLCFEVTKASDGTYQVIASDESIDRYQDIVEAAGWRLENYGRNPLWLVDHDYVVQSIVGVGVDVRVSGGRLVASYKPDPINSSIATDVVLAKLDSLSLRAVSVGFMPIRWERISDEKGNWTGGFRYLEQDLLEISWVAVPANPNATLLGIDPNAVRSTPPPAPAGRVGEPSDRERALRELQLATVGLWAQAHRGALAAKR